MNRILLYNHSGCENRGCEAIVRATAALFSGCNVRLSSGQAAYDAGLSLPGISRITGTVIAPYSLRRFINSVGFRLGMPREQEVARRYAPVIDAGRRSDICLSVGGDTYCYADQEHMRVINGRLKRAGKPLVLWGCSVDPQRLKGQCLEDLRAYDLIVARESITQQSMQEAGLPVIGWCDPAFTLGTELLPLPPQWREGDTVGVNVSPLVLSRAKDGEAALDAFATLVAHILASGSSAVALLPHVTWPHDDDMQALSRIKARFEGEERVFLLPGTLTAPQYKGYIARMRALVTARTHASIAAYSSAVPTLVVGYSVKAKGIARDLFGGEDGHLIAAQELDGAWQLIRLYDAMIAREEEERALLMQRLPGYIQGQKETVRTVLALAQKRSRRTQ